MLLQGEVQLQNNGDRTGMFEVFQIRGKLRPDIVFLQIQQIATMLMQLIYFTLVVTMDKVLLRYTVYANH